jgi:tetratricopeptide (TPR) repeat protein
MMKNPFGDYQKAKILLEKALDLTPQPSGWRAFILNSLGSVLRFTGDYKQGILLLQESIEFNEKRSYYWGLNFAHNTLGMIYTLIGNHKKAQDNFQLSLDYSLKEDNYRGLGFSWGSMGWLESKLGNFLEATAFYKKSIEAFKQRGSVPSIILLAQAEVLSQITDQITPEMQKLIEQAKNQIWKHKNKLNIGRYYISLGNISFNNGDLVQAEKKYSKASEFSDTHEVKTQCLLGKTKINMEFFMKTDGEEFLKLVKETILELQELTKDKFTLIWAEMELISAILLIYEKSYEISEEKFRSLLSYAEKNSLTELISRINNQLQNLQVFRTYEKVRRSIQDISKENDLKTQSMMDIAEYLKAATYILRSYSSDSVEKR